MELVPPGAAEPARRAGRTELHQHGVHGVAPPARCAGGVGSDDALEAEPIHMVSEPIHMVSAIWYQALSAAALREHGAEQIVVVVQGKLVGSTIEDAGLAATVKTPKPL